MFFFNICIMIWNKVLKMCNFYVHLGYNFNFCIGSTECHMIDVSWGLLQESISQGNIAQLLIFFTSKDLIYVILMIYTHLGRASCHWWALGCSGCCCPGYRTLFIWGGRGRTFGCRGLTSGRQSGWAGFGRIWFSWSHIKLVEMKWKKPQKIET